MYFSVRREEKCIERVLVNRTWMNGFSGPGFTWCPVLEFASLPGAAVFAGCRRCGM